MYRLILTFLILGSLFNSRAWAEGPAAQRLQRYQVQAGDTCAGLAKRFYGSSKRYDVIHRHNPDMGSAPHRLKPGSFLNLPPSADDAPDAVVTEAIRVVNAQEPISSEWQPAVQGLPLYRGWRVSTEQKSAAELTFSDASAIHLRENTLVIVYGSSVGPLRADTSAAYLERGTLRSFLDKLPLRVRTPGAEAGLANGQALLDVDGEAVSRLSNFRGGAAALQNAHGPAVAVAPGFGSKVIRGKPPEPPRPLPPSPVWLASTPAQFATVAGQSGSIAGEWRPVTEAAAYWVEVSGDSKGRTPVFATRVPARIHRFEAHRLPPGEYFVRVSTIDGDRFESPPSDARSLTLIQLRLVEPGAGEIEGTDPGDPSQAPQEPSMPLGSVIEAPEGLRCATVSEAAEADGVGPAERANHGSQDNRSVVEAAGRQAIRCRDADGNSLPPYWINVTRPQVEATFADQALQLEPGKSLTLRYRVSEGVDLAALAADTSAGLRVVTAPHVDGSETVMLAVQALENASGAQTVQLGVRQQLPTAAPNTEATLQKRAGTRATASATQTEDTTRSPLVSLHRAVILVRPPATRASLPPPPPLSVPASAAVAGSLPTPDLTTLRTFPKRVRAQVGLAFLGSTARTSSRAVRTYAEVDAGLRTGDAGYLRASLGYGRDLDDGNHISRGTTGLQAGLGFRTELSPLELAALLDGWIPLGEGANDVESVRLLPGIQARWTLQPRLVLASRQSASLALGSDRNRLWSSTYGAHYQLLGPLTLAGGLDLSLGERVGNPHLACMATAGLLIQVGLLEINLAARIALTDDAWQRYGRLGLLANASVHL